MKMLLSFEGKKCLVVGAGSGIGRSTAIKLAHLGGRIVLTGRDKGKLDDTMSCLAGSGHHVMPFDFTQFDKVRAFLKDCVDIDNTKLDCVLFAAGQTRGRLIKNEDMASYREIMQSNSDALMSLLISLSSRRILNNGGAIVGVSSAAVVHCDKYLASYAAGKAAVDTMCGVASREFAKRKVRVNTVVPEMTDTPMAHGFFERASDELKNQLYPLGTLTADEVADAIIFLLSDMSRKITGQHLYLSAGNDGRPIEGYNI